MNIHEDLEWLSTTDMGQVLKKNKPKTNNRKTRNEWVDFLCHNDKHGMAGLTVTRPWFHPHPHKCCGGLGSRQNWTPTRVRGCEWLEAPRTPLKCSTQWNHWQCSPEDRSGRHCYRKNTGLPACLGRVCIALGVFWRDCWRLASWSSAEAERGDSLQ